MAIFGISASHNGDVPEEFIRREIACTIQPRGETSEDYALFRQFRVGDLVFIKAYTPQDGLRVSAVGVVTSSSIAQVGQGACIAVEWIWQGKKHIEIEDDICPLRENDVYEEQNLEVQREILDLLPASYRLPDVWAAASAEEDVHELAA